MLFVHCLLPMLLLSCKQVSATSDLSFGLLAEILSRLSVHERFHHAAHVNRSWQKAAAIATKEIYANTMPSNPDSVSAWLAANCPDAALHSIFVEDLTSHMPSLQLPVQHLQHLSKLQLFGLRVAAVQYSSPQAAAPAEAALHPLGLAPLTALKELVVSECDMRLDSLSALTDLRSLAY